MNIYGKVHVQRNLASKQILEPDTSLPCHDVSCAKNDRPNRCCADLSFKHTASFLFWFFPARWEQGQSAYLRVSDYQRSSNGSRRSRRPRQGKNTCSYGDAHWMKLIWVTLVMLTSSPTMNRTVKLWMWWSIESQNQRIAKYHPVIQHHYGKWPRDDLHWLTHWIWWFPEIGVPPNSPFSWDCPW